MKRALLVVAVAVLLSPATGHAAAPCRNRIYNDWYADGRIASTYSHACYVDALRHLPVDAKVYSSLGDDIRSAMLAAGRRAVGKTVPAQVGRGFESAKGSTSLATLHGKGPHDPALGMKAASKTVLAAPVAASSSGGLPVPILVLGALALALAAAGAVGAGVKYGRARRR